MPGLQSVESLLSKGEGPAHAAGSLLSMGLGKNDSMLGKAIGKLTKSDDVAGSKINEALAKGDKIRSAGPLSSLDQEADLRKKIADQGTFSMLDVPIGMVRALPPVKKLLPQEKWDNTLFRYQSKLLNADRSGGEAVVRALPFTKRLFTSNDMQPLLNAKTEAGNTVKGFVPVETQRLTAPLDKAKDFASPFLAVLGVGSVYDSINRAKAQKDKKEGELGVSALTREELIEKIAKRLASEDIPLDKKASFLSAGGDQAAHLQNIHIVRGALNRETLSAAQHEEACLALDRAHSGTQGGQHNYAELKQQLQAKADAHGSKKSASEASGMEKNAAMLKASAMLILASEKIASLNESNTSLAKDNDDLKLLVTAKERSSRSVKLAKSMLLRGMLKQAEYDAQIDEIMDMDDKSYDVLYNAIQSTPLVKSAAEISPWAFMVGVPDSTPERRSFDDAIIEASSRKNYQN